MPGKKVYEQLCRMNQGFEKVRHSLQALSRHTVLQPKEIQRFEHWMAEARAASNCLLL